MQTTWEHTQVGWKAHYSLKYNDKLLGYNTTKTALNEQITTVYTHQNKLLEQDRFPFAMSLEQWQHKSISKMKMWLKKTSHSQITTRKYPELSKIQMSKTYKCFSLDEP
eukprot:12163082-Ditylum_brightwellii.AAC.1